MNILGNLLSKILGRNPFLPVGTSTPAAAAAPAPAPVTPPEPVTPAQEPPETAAPIEAAVPAPAPPPEPVDIEEVLAELAAKSAEKLDWKRSIVDLMKLVGMDSSLSARKELAEELGYSGDLSDSAKMNVWLHKQVLQKLAENGGKVPAELLD